MIHRLDDEADHIHVLLLGHRGCLTGRTTGDDGIRATRDLLLYELRQLLIIYRTICMKWSHQRDSCASEKCHNYLRLCFGFLTL